MASKNPQTMAKRAREQAVKERRENKAAKRAARRAEAAGESGEPNETLAQPQEASPSDG